MKKSIRIAAFSLAAVLCLSLAGCSGSENSSSGGTSAASSSEPAVDPLAAAQENLNAAKSLDASMVMDMKMEAAGQNVDSVTTMDMTYFSDPVRMKVDFSMDMGQVGSADMAIYAEETDGVLTMYLNDGTSWQKAENASADDLEGYNVRSNMAYYLDSCSNYAAAGTEQLEGANTYKYTGTITGDAMKEVVLSSGALNSLNSMVSDSSELEGMLDGLGDLPVTVWIDETKLYPVRYEMDMTEVMDGLIAKVLESMGSQVEGLEMKITQMNVVMTVSNLNAATEFAIPDEAKAA